MRPEEAALRCGRAVTVDVEGFEPLLFRAPTPMEARDFSKQLLAYPELEIALSTDMCEKCCLSEVVEFHAVVDYHPLIAMGREGILAHLLKVSQENLKATVKGAAARWRRADRNYGHTAENLLAFKAYTGGDYTEQEFAGALAVAEWAGAAKNLCKLMEGLMKSLSRKSG